MSVLQGGMPNKTTEQSVQDGYDHQPLGLGTLILRSFSLFLRHLPVFMLIALVPTVSLNMVSMIMFPDTLHPLPMPGPGPGRSYGVPGIRLVVMSALSAVVIMLMMGTMVLAAHSAKHGQPIMIGRLVGQTLAAAPAILVLGALYLGVVSFGLVLLLVPGLYLLARYWVLPMAILVEDAGFSGMTRAAELTRGYRWPILAALLTMILLTAITVLAVFLTPMLLLGGTIETAPGEPDFAVFMLIQSLANAAQYALIAAFTAQLYSRLREIKDGRGMEDVAAIFE